MKARRHLTSFCVIFVVLGLLPLAQGQHESSDEASVAVLIKSYYDAYAQRDLGALVLLWSERWPDLAASIEEAQKTLAVDDYAFSNVAVSLARVAGNKAILQVTANATITNSITRATRDERSIRNFALIKEGGQWKVWRDAPASQDLSAFLDKGSEWKISRDTIEQFATVLVAARNEEERNTLLADNKQMLTTELRDVLMRRVGPQRATGGYEAALRTLQIALAVAERTADKEGIHVEEITHHTRSKAWNRAAQALRQAMLKLLARDLYRHPFYWAGFEVIGNGR
ncbi:MAG: hypothetical protein AABN33_19915 [Acidobacteriota bacterium]